MKNDTGMQREPFVTTWWGIALQLVTALWLIGMGVYLWLQR